jgi:predicted RNase H-like nuclease (RuvC/YqgF family)
MTVLWIFIILALAIVAGHYRAQYLALRQSSAAALARAVDSYDALEEGMNEQIENYENEFLQYQETNKHLNISIENLHRHITDLEVENEELKEVAQFHQANCLPHLGEYKNG